MNKFIFLFLGIFLFYGINESKAQTQKKVFTEASVNIIEPSQIAQVRYISSLIQIVPVNTTITGQSIVFHSENGKQISSAIQNLASFSVNPECNSSFSVSLPSNAIILKNSKNKNPIQVDGWHASGQPGKDEFQNDIWVVNMGASLKIATVSDKQGGFYTGTFPVSFDYN